MSTPDGRENADQAPKIGNEKTQPDPASVNVLQEGGSTGSAPAQAAQSEAKTAAVSPGGTSPAGESVGTTAESAQVARPDVETTVATNRLGVTRGARTGTRSRKPCNCKNSKCLKLYCDCFAAGIYCEDCHCVNCLNRPAYEALRQSAIRTSLERNPNAFRSKVVLLEAGAKELGAVTSTTEDASNKEKNSAGDDCERKSEETGSDSGSNASLRTPTSKMIPQRHAQHIKGCSCLRSQCLKKYCECFQNSVFCSASCRCSNCRNFEGSAELSQARERQVLAELGISFSHQRGASGTPTKSSLTEMIEAGVLTEESIRSIGLEAVLEKAKSWRKRSSGETTNQSPSSSRSRRSKRTKSESSTPPETNARNPSSQASPHTPPSTWQSGFMTGSARLASESPMATPASGKVQKRREPMHPFGRPDTRSPSATAWMTASPNARYSRNTNMAAQMQHVWLDHTQMLSNEQLPAAAAIARLQSRHEMPHRAKRSPLPAVLEPAQPAYRRDANYPKPEHPPVITPVGPRSLISPAKRQAAATRALLLSMTPPSTNTAPTMNASGARDALTLGTPVPVQEAAAKSPQRVLDLREAMHAGNIAMMPSPGNNTQLLLRAAKRMDSAMQRMDGTGAANTPASGSAGRADTSATPSWDEQLAADALQHLKNHSG